MTTKKPIGEGALSWMRRAACEGMDTDLFFPPPGVNVPKEIKAVCGSCPVTDECYSYAVDHGLDMGIFGGAAAIERIRARRAREARRATAARR